MHLIEVLHNSGQFDAPRFQQHLGLESNPDDRRLGTKKRFTESRSII